MKKKIETISGVLYRYENDYEQLICNVFKIQKETPEGYWILHMKKWGVSNKRWMSKTSKNRFARLNKNDALKDFLFRKEMQITILENKIDACQLAIEEAEKLLKGEKK